MYKFGKTSKAKVNTQPKLWKQRQQQQTEQLHTTQHIVEIHWHEDGFHKLVACTRLTVGFRACREIHAAGCGNENQKDRRQEEDHNDGSFCKDVLER